MQEQREAVETHIRPAGRAEWIRPKVGRLEAYDAEATRSGLSQDAVYS
jgi:hypothetical protein